MDIGSSMKITHTIICVASNLLVSFRCLLQIEIAAMVKKLAEQQHSTELAQLASRITSVMRYE
eukprot:1742999-Amphidinium_carterae.1